MAVRRALIVMLVAACSPSPGLDARPPNSSCVAFARPRSPIEIEPAYPGLVFAQPIQMTLDPDGWWYLIERAGKVWRFRADGPAEGEPERQLVLDLSAVVDMSGDDGLVGIALHPQFATTREMFLAYARAGTTSVLESRVSRFRSSDGGATFDPASEEIVLQLDQHERIHVGGDLKFGPDGYLYIGFGDGANAEHVDPFRRFARDPASWHGKILRIDVDASPYAIPSDNPFAGGGGAPEVWAVGLRNPWRFTFDRQTGALYAGDVGWASWEEISRIEPGGDYGWDIYEGPRCLVTEGCDDPALSPPLVSMFHDQARSIVAGHVYRGTRIPSLVGRLVFADFITGHIWAIDPDEPEPFPQVLRSKAGAIVSFAEDRDGEQLFLDLLAGTIWRIVPSDHQHAPDEAPLTLTATSCFEANGRPNRGLIPYDLNWPFWSDGVTKRRWLALPEGAQIAIDDEQRFVLPPGAVAIKEFSIDGVRIETRLLVHHEDGVWAGYTYAWRPGQDDADLVPLSEGAFARNWSDGWWYYPRRTQCMDCHTSAAGITLGLQLGQLDRAIQYPNGRVANQLDTLAHIGVFEDRVPMHVRFPAIDDTHAPLADRARAWLHVNCAHCHRPGATGGHFDLRYTTPDEDMGICNVKPTRGGLGLVEPHLVTPLDPSRSVVFARINTEDSTRMPPIVSGFGTIDHDGAALVADWIANAACGALEPSPAPEDP